MKNDDHDQLIENHVSEEYASEFGIHHSIQEMDAKSKIGSTIQKMTDRKEKDKKNKGENEK